MRGLRFPLGFALLAVLLIPTMVGCGSSRESFVLSGGPGGGPTTPPGPVEPIAPTGSIEVRSLLMRAIPRYVVELQFFGLNEADQEIYDFGPVPKSVRVRLEQVPIEVTKLRIEYRTDKAVVGVFETAVEVLANQVTVVDNPEWDDLPPPAADFESRTLAGLEGSAPIAGAAADLNGNGVLDLLNSDSGLDGFTVRLGLGEAQFGEPKFFPSGPVPVGIHTGDFNGDGHLDVAISNYGRADEPGFVTVHFGDGQGGFGEPSVLTAGEGPTELAVADFNGDGHLDIVSCNLLSHDVTVFLGDGLGGFTDVGQFPTAAPQPSRPLAGTRPRALAVGDLNRDGFPDLISANEGPPGGGDASVLLNRGDGTFFPPLISTIGSVGHSVALGDLDGDGLLDAVVANLMSDDVSVLLGKGNGTFQPSREFAAGRIPLSVRIDDYNGNGILDVAAAASGDGRLSLLPGLGDGTLGERQEFEAGDLSFFLIPGDFNGDGKPDLVTTDLGSDSLTLFLNLGSGPE